MLLRRSRAALEAAGETPAPVPEPETDEAQGVEVESDLAGTGEAVNEATSEVTRAGESLPEVPADPDGDAVVPEPETDEAVPETPAEPAAPARTRRRK